jgi:tetratricopeptide (TPR) repeat protein
MQLIRTADGVPIWGRNYDVRRTDLLTIEDEVSKQVADALRVQLIAREGARYRAPASPAAYEAYLQGRALLMNYSEAKMRAAVESFEAALRVDPDYARARAGLATAFAWFSVRYAYQNDALLWGRRAEEEATRALTLDRDLADAHLALADAAGTTYGHFNWPRVLAEAAEALRLDPALDPAHASRARALYHLGLFDAARREVAAAIALTGASNVETDRLLVAIALFDGRFADARQRAEELAGRSDAPVIRMYLATARFYLGERDQAAALLASIKRGAEPDLRSQAILAGVLAANGRRAAAQDMLDAVARNPAMDHHVAYSVGAAFAQLGRAAEAVRWLRTSANDGFACYPWYASDPLLDPIRNEAGFTELMEELRRRFESARGRYDTRPPV